MPQNQVESDEDVQPKNGIPFRKNVLALMRIAYGVLFLIFAVAAVFDTPSKAYEVVSVPFVALIGGTLAIAKDIIK